MAKLGWLGLPFPEEQGGAGLGLVELCLVLEEMGRAAYPGPYFASVVLGGLGLMLGGSAAQKEKWLSAIAAGQARASAALLEDSLDWAPATTAATATRDGRRLVAVGREALRALGARGRRRARPRAVARGALALPRGPEAGGRDL